MSRSKNETWLPWRSTLRSNSLGYIFLNDVRNSLSSFIARRSSMNLETASYSYALDNPFEMSCFIYLDSNK